MQPHEARAAERSHPAPTASPELVAEARKLLMPGQTLAAFFVEPDDQQKRFIAKIGRRRRAELENFARDNP